MPVAVERCAKWDSGSVRKLEDAHSAWWKSYWARGWIELPSEPLLERFFYGSVYLLGASARRGKVAPGLYGPWATADSVSWSGDYHLDYNFQHAWYGVYAVNRPDLAEPYLDAIVNLQPLAREVARKVRQEGVVYRTGAGPYGWSHPSCHDMPNNAECAMNFRDYWEFTRDTGRLERDIYPFLKEVAANWDARLIKENQAGPSGAEYRYKVVGAWDESARKVDNPVASLSYVRALYQALASMSAELGSDPDSRPRWLDIIAHLSRYPTTEYKGRKVFDFGEGCNNAEGNPYPYNTYPFYPAATETMDSPFREVLVDTLRTRPSYFEQMNAFTQVYAAGAQGGYPADELSERLRDRLRALSRPDGIVLVPGHKTLENAVAVNNVTMLLLQSGGGVIRVFPVWNLTRDARFVNLRARGAFLVSAEVSGGIIHPITITSEKGLPVSIMNPWPGRELVMDDGRERMLPVTRRGEVYTFSTKAGHSYRLDKHE